MTLKPPPVTARSVAEPVNDRGPSWDFFNPDMDRMVDELQRERETLDTQRKQLDDLALRLQAERAEINQITQTVHQLQFEFDKGFLKVKEEEAANLKKLARLFAAMDPEVTIKQFEKMDDDEIVQYLVLKKDTETVSLLETFAKKGDAQTRRVGALTDRLRETLFRNAPKP
jgi:hypothetical protein